MSTEAASPSGGSLIKTAELTDRVIRTEGIEGITISGGEPFDQAAALSELIDRIQAARDLGVIVYTGYVYAELAGSASVAAENHQQQLLTRIDLLIDGPYIDELNDGLSLRGSSNQTIHALSPRYRGLAAQYYGLPQRKVELHVNADHLLLAGVPGAETLQHWKERKQAL